MADSSFESEENVDVSSGTVVDLAPPDDYKVILLNDDYTTKEFVVSVLKVVFKKTDADAIQIMESIHKSGSGVAGIYTYDIAATKARLTMTLARRESFPLRCRLEKV